MLIAGLTFGADRALALACSFGFSSINFGVVDVTTDAAISGTASFTADCSGIAGKTVLVCPNLGAGSGGARSDGEVRYMIGAGGQIAYQVYRNPQRTQSWGSTLTGWGGSAPPTLIIPLGTGGVGAISQVAYAQIFAGQTTAPVGSYASSFGGAELRVRYGYADQGSCESLSGALEASASLLVQASVVPRCTVSASTLDFGVIGTITQSIDATNQLSLVCSAGAAYSIGLDNGRTGNAPDRRQLRKDRDTVTYGLYRDPGRVLPWGNSEGSDTMGGTGTGATQRYIVYGRVPIQPSPVPGNYSDTVVVTVTY